MSLVTVSEKRNRLYPRAFDHDEARRLHEENPELWTYQALSDRFGVSPAAIARVLDPRVRARMEANTRKYQREKRRPCLGGCGRLVWHNGKGRTGKCSACVMLERAMRNVADDTLRCPECGQWKADDEFPPMRPSRREGPAARARRGRDTYCRDCVAAQRRDHRRRNLEAEQLRDRETRDRRREGTMLHVVLRENGAGWEEVATVEATNADKAVEAAATEPGRYVAVIETRFRPVSVDYQRSLKVQPDAPAAS